MNAETLEALRGSIRKWQAIVAGTGIDDASENCPLCRMFVHLRKCGQCPVALAGFPGCAGSPYTSWAKLVDWEVVSAETPEQKIAAQTELDFLISLLPEGEAP